SAATFWAQKKKGITNGTPAAKTPAVQNTPAPKAATENASSLVLTRKSDAGTNGASSPANGLSVVSKATGRSWADDFDDDDDQTLNSPLSAKMAPRIHELEAQVEAKDERIEELKQSLGLEGHRVKDLETAIEDKDRRIAELETDAEKKREMMAKLDEALSQASDRGEEMDQLVKQMEATFNEQTARIQELEMQLETANDTAARRPEPTAPEAKQVEETASEAIHANEEITQEETLKSEVVDTASKASETTAIAQDGKSKASTPAFRDISEPVFATPETVKAAPPVPPAPKLKMGIDMSKYGKKPATVTKDVKSGACKPIRTGTSAARKSDVMPTINPLKDMRSMSREQRQPFANGGDVDIMVGTTAITVPKYMYMQVSANANNFFTKNPTATKIQFPAGSMDITSVQHIARWMIDHTYCGRVFSINLHNDERKNLQVMRASRMLGLRNMYVAHFTRGMCDRLREKMPSPELMALIEELSVDNDPVFDCLANNLATQRFKNNLPHPQAFEAFLAKHPKLAAAIAKIEDKLRINRTRRSSKSR
ncbi:hypothetical protein BDV95DRAFT_461700, partial [Massariosphaeria phaeospora]